MLVGIICNKKALSFFLLRQIIFIKFGDYLQIILSPVILLTSFCHHLVYYVILYWNSMGVWLCFTQKLEKQCIYTVHKLSKLPEHVWHSSLPSTLQPYAETSNGVPRHQHELLQRAWLTTFLPLILKTTPQSIELLTTHTHILNHIHILELQQKYADWSQCSGIEKKSGRKKIHRKEDDGGEVFWCPFWEQI